MMKKTKRILSMILAACMVLSVIVPAAFAEESIVYNFLAESGTGDKMGVDANPNGGFSFKSENPCTMLNISWQQHGFNADPRYFTARFTKDARKAKSWVAIEIANVVADTYDMTFDVALAGSGGVSNVYVLTKEAYTEVIGDAADSTSYLAKLKSPENLSLEDNESILDELKEKNAILNNDGSGTINCEEGKADRYQSIGKVTFTDDGDYVLFIQSNTSGEDGKCFVQIRGLTMTPVTTEETFEEKIENATSGTITLTQNETVGDIVIKDGVTLDLNGMELTAASVTTLGTGNVIDSSAKADGILKVAANKLSLQSTNSQFALYDSVNGGYKFYTATITNNVKTETVDSATSKYWFRITFSADSAYDLIARGDSGLKIEAALNWTGGSKTATPEASFYAGWAPAVKANPNIIAISLTVKGVDQVQELTVTASVTNTATAAAQ